MTRRCASSRCQRIAMSPEGGPGPRGLAPPRLVRTISSFLRAQCACAIEGSTCAVSAFRHLASASAYSCNHQFPHTRGRQFPLFSCFLPSKFRTARVELGIESTFLGRRLCLELFPFDKPFFADSPHSVSKTPQSKTGTPLFDPAKRPFCRNPTVSHHSLPPAGAQLLV